MYGLLIEGVVIALKKKYGKQKYESIREWAGVKQHSFVTHERYSDTIIPKIARAAVELTDDSLTDIMQLLGLEFLLLLSSVGYDQMLRVLGKSVSEFLNGLDNLHAYLRSSYPKMKSPSFICENETKVGLTLHYRTHRKGFIYYVIGLIKGAGTSIFDVKIDIEVISVQERDSQCHVIMQIHFENNISSDLALTKSTLPSYTVEMGLIQQIMPFHIWYGSDMVVRSAGYCLNMIMPNLKGSRADHLFTMVRPPLEFTFRNVLNHANSMFEIISMGELQRKNSDDEDEISDKDDNESDGKSTNDNSSYLRLKGQMWYIDSQNVFIFIATPIIANLERLYDMKIYLQDMAMHDSSRDLLLIDNMRSKGLKGSLNQEKIRTKKMEGALKLLDIEIKRTDELLYQMIPEETAKRLRSGENMESMCETFDEVTVLFSSVIGFNDICNESQPMDIVNLLNSMFTKFDSLSEIHGVHKVETTGDSYMAVTGAPIVNKYHALQMSNMALEMRNAGYDINNPITRKHVEIRIGIHSGKVVAGVVGLRMPRYCLFGDTVNTASRMCSNAEPMVVQISETTKLHLQSFPYTMESRGTIPIKGKGEMNTYYLIDKSTNFSIPDENEEAEIEKLKEEVGVARNSATSLTNISQTSVKRSMSIADLQNKRNSEIKELEKKKKTSKTCILL